MAIANCGRDLYEITGSVGTWVADAGFASGIMTVFCRHAPASVPITESADAAARIWPPRAEGIFVFGRRVGHHERRILPNQVGE